MLSSKSTRRFSLYIPELPKGRVIDSAWVEIPHNFFSEGLARICLPKKYILKVPHVESDGHLCISGDPGPSSGSSPKARLNQLIDLFYSSFIEPWSQGNLDSHFYDEALNYWAIHYSRCFSPSQPVRKVYTTDFELSEARVYTSPFLTQLGVVIAGQNSSFRQRCINAISNTSTIASVKVAEVPISFPFTPDSWPKSLEEIERLVIAKIGPDKATKLFESTGRRNRKIHQVVIFRAPRCSFGYLLPGGPPLQGNNNSRPKPHYQKGLTPLKVERLDTSWTTGRDQHPEYIDRQLKHVLVIGAGALGSPVSEQLAKAGVGKLSLVDDDTISAANVGRHSLGLNSIGSSKVHELAKNISKRWPSCRTNGFHMPIQKWLKSHSLNDVDMILDLTGEPDVRLLIDQKRRKNDSSLIIAWMEPFVASAHACLFPVGRYWMTQSTDKLESLNTVDWPDDVMQNEPACSSVFQSYTSAAATHAVALTTEAALDLIDNKIVDSVVRHWIRGQQYLDSCRPGLKLREWAQFARDFDGIIKELRLE